MQTPRKRWELHFTERLAAAEHPPASVKLRVGQGVHILCHDEGEQLFHMIVAPLSDPSSCWARTAHGTLRFFAKEDALAPRQEGWLQAVKAGLEAAEQDPDWLPFLDTSGDKAGISVAKTTGAAEVITSGEELVVRLLEPCNARCEFCGCIGVMNDATSGMAQAEQRMREGHAVGYRRVVFTGGEPTLLRDLPAYVELARSIGYDHVNLQTNGVKLADRSLCEALKAAGLDSVLMSLHSHRAETHDAVLKLPGAFEGAVQGIDHCIDVGIKVHLNFVLHDQNLPDLVDYLKWVYKRFDRAATPTWHGHVGVTLSFVSPIGWTLEHLERVPQITQAAPILAEALELAEALALEVHVPGLCGLPLCTMPGYERYFDESRGGTPPQLDTRSKLDVCGDCAHNDRCSGYWNVYFDLYGTHEFGPGPRPWGRDDTEPAADPALLRVLAKLAETGKPTFVISQLLNRKKIRTPRGGLWTDERVIRVLEDHGIPYTAFVPPTVPERL